MHMKLVHPVPDWRKFECDNYEKDNATKDIIEDKVDEDVLRVKRIYYDVFEKDPDVI